MAKTLAALRNAALQLSNYETSGFIQTPELTDRINEAVLAFYDLALSARETYFQKTFTFSLAGGIGGNTVSLPSDLYKVQALDYRPNTSSVETVPTLPSFRERHSVGRRSYDYVPGTLTVYPSITSAGQYELYYTPYAPVLADPVTVSTAYTTVSIAHHSGDNLLQASGLWTFGNATFDSTYVGRYLYIAGATNTANDGLHLILTYIDSTHIDTAPGGVNETFPSNLIANVYTGPFDSYSSGSNTWTFNGLTASQLTVGGTITIAGTVSNNGTYTVQAVTGANSFQTTTGSGTSETFLPGANITYQPVGTVDTLPPILQLGELWIELFTAQGILEKAEEDSAPVAGRLAAQTARIQNTLRWKQDEPRQVPLVRRRFGYGYGWGGGWE